MKTFMIYSCSDTYETTWFVNAQDRKEAIRCVQRDEEFYEDEDIVSCEEINTKRTGVVFIKCKAL